MGERGPRPKPTALRVLEGNVGHRPLPVNEPKPRLGAPEEPSGIPPMAVEKWRAVVQEMSAVPGWLARIDADLLAAYCRSFARFTAAEAVLNELGPVYEQITTQIDTNGTPVDRKKLMPRPEVKIARDERTAMLQLGKVFGFGPANRAGISITRPGHAEDDDLDTA